MKPTKLITPSAARLKKIRLYLGMTREQFGKQLSISQYTIRSWEDGAKKLTAPGAERIISALQIRIKFNCSLEWLMHGTGTSPISMHEEHKIENNTIKVESDNEKILNEIVLLKKNNPKAEIILVSDDTFAPIANIGDYLGMITIDFFNYEKYLDKLLITTHRNGQMNFGILKKSGRSINLYNCFNSSASKLSKHTIDKASQIIWIRKL